MTQPQSHMIDGPAGDLAAHDWGGTGAPVLIAHATGFHGRIWAPVVERLLVAGRHVWSFDFRGHGDSAAPDPDGDTYAWGNFATDALAVVDHLGLAGDPELIACGHSKGGTALLLGEARRPGTYPRVWAFEPIMFPTETLALMTGDDFGMAASARKRRNEWPSRDAAYDAYASKRPLNVMTAESLHAYVGYGLRDRGDGVYELKCTPAVEAAVYTNAPKSGAWELLPDITSTVRVVCGAESRDIPPALAERIAERLPHGSLEVWAGMGHFGPQQDPERAATSILDFANG